MRRFRLLALIWAVGLPGVQADADPKSYTLEILPNLVTDSTTYDHITPVAVNERGAVVGYARSSDPGHEESVLFHYRRGRMRALDSGGLSAEPLALNDRGVVLGQVGSSLDKRFFKTRRGRAARFLEGGLPESELGKLRATDLGINGEVLAFIADQGGASSYIHRRRAGQWELVTSEDPHFDEFEVYASRINGVGDILLYAHSESGRASVFILRSQGAVEVVRPEAEGLAFADSLTDKRSVAGAAIRVKKAFKAFYYDPRTGLLDIHPEGFTSSQAHVQPTGLTLVRASQRGRTSYFSFHPDEGLTRLWNSDDVRELGARAGCKKPEEAEIVLERWNRRREAFALLQCVGKGRGSVHYSPETGFTLMRDVLRGFGFADRYAAPIDFNQRGQILLSFHDGDRTVGALLTPSN